jgi:dihydroneopterin aldolase
LPIRPAQAFSDFLAKQDILMDIVFVKQLAVDTVIGVYAWEKTIQQRLMFDLELTTDIRAAASADDIRQTLDYAVVCERVSTLVQSAPVELIETLAERIAAMLLTEFATAQVMVQVDKPGAVPAAQTVGVRIVRSRG